jgi:hypothetical protein
MRKDVIDAPAMQGVYAVTEPSIYYIDPTVGSAWESSSRKYSYVIQ